MAFENVEAGSGLEVEHDDRPFGCCHRETLGVHVEVDGREAVRGTRQFHEKDYNLEDRRLNHMYENLRGSVDSGFTVVGRIWVERFDDCLDQTRKVRLDRQRTLR